MTAERERSVLRHRNQVVDAFEAEWARGEIPRIEEYLPLGGANRAGLLQALINIEVQWRRKSGERVAHRDISSRFPELTRNDQVKMAGNERRGLDDAAGIHGELPAQETVIEPGKTSHGDDESPRLPLQIGRFRVEQLLGKGGFGLVFLARDDQLDRLVAIKVPHARRLRDLGDTRLYLEEARLVAGLDHPHIVPVYDVGSTERFPLFVVSKYIDGSTLAVRAKQHPYSPYEAASLIALVAEALQYAHTHGVVHRDVKPGNILIDHSGKPYLTDFGLALHERDFGTGAVYAGTPAYMSPEQARGEGHRVDGRSDIFSVGVVLYELLAGRRPFGGKGDASVLSRIASADPKPPRQIREGIPKELERICLRALARRAVDRYSTAQDLSDDLKAFLGEAEGQPITMEFAQAGNDDDSFRTWPTRFASSSSSPLEVVPRGLRSFDHHDAEFFLNLLPGPKDRDGLPESVRFWKVRIEETDADATFPVGLIYGPSGCGKSSLVKAGLLPRLSEEVLPIYIEATAGRSAIRLLNAIRKACPLLAEAPTLAEAITALRLGRGGTNRQKVLIVIDQFEQWLHAPDLNEDMVAALRQCDGAKVQCLILARDDFCVAVGRFFQALEVPIREGHNYALVDLFDVDHARKVLHSFGHAFGKLPLQRRDLTSSQREFLDHAVAGLATHGKVISLRLALFAEMMRGKNWEVEALRRLGGAEGIGFAFLEETFAARIAPPTHRMHEQAARAILRALLPESGTDIRGRMQPESKLLEVSGYKDRPKGFRSLIEILERDVRLIAPTEPDENSVEQEPYYQLTHDFLVPALRDWLYRTQRETVRGRAELCLIERAALWQERKESKQLPDLAEWLRILTLTPRRLWTEPQRSLMRHATRRHVSRLAIAGVTFVLLAVSGLLVRNYQSERKRHELVQGLIEQLWTAEPSHLAGVLDRLEGHDRLWRSSLNSIAESQSSDADRRVRAFLALSRTEPVGIDTLRSQILEADAAEHALLRAELLRWKEKVAPGLWRVAFDQNVTGGQRLRAAAALAAFEPSDERWGEISKAVASTLTSLDPLASGPWIEALQPVRVALAPSLVAISSDPTAQDDERSLAAGVIRRYAELDADSIAAEQLAEAALTANPAQRSILLPVLRQRKGAVRPLLDAELSKSVSLTTSEESERGIERQANAAELLLRMGHGDAFWKRLTASDDPRLRTALIARMRFARLSWEEIAAQLSMETDASVRQAIMLGLADCRAEMTAAEREKATERLLSLFASDPHPGIHSASEWVLNQWGESGRVAAVNREAGASPPQDAEWLINGQGHTLAVIRAPGRFQVGSPDDEPGRNVDEVIREEVIDYPFAVGVREITVAEFMASDGLTPSEDIADYPGGFISWYDAVRYCRWLSEQENIPEDEMCYPPRDQIGPDMVLAPGFHLRTGYRLPTSTEWEYVARAGTRTSRFYGNDLSKLSEYAWYAPNSEERPWPGGMLKPNLFGIYDIYGNVMEWIDGTGLPADKSRGWTRGGNYRATPKYLRSASFDWYPPETEVSIIGFRIVRTLQRDTP